MTDEGKQEADSHREEICEGAIDPLLQSTCSQTIKFLELIIIIQLTTIEYLIWHKHQTKNVLYVISFLLL